MWTTYFYKAHDAEQGQSGQTADAKQHATKSVYVAHCFPIQPPT